MKWGNQRNTLYIKKPSLINLQMYLINYILNIFTAMENEIDVRDLILAFISVTKKRIFVILFIFVVVILSGFLIHKVKRKTFEYHTEIYSDSRVGPDIDEVGPMVEQLIVGLNDIMINEDYTQLSKVMQLEQENVINLVQITCEQNKENPNLYGVDLMVAETANIDNVEKGILNYIQNNEFVKALLAAKKERYQSSVLFMDKEINSVDSLINEYTQKGATVNLGNLEESLMELKDKRDEYKMELDMLQMNFSFLKPFSKPVPKVNLKNYILVSVFFALFISFFLVLGTIIFEQKKTV